MSTAMPDFTVEVNFSPGASPEVWTDITADVLSDLSFRYGIPGSGPLDRVASSGDLTFTLDNSAGNSGGTLGYYSPEHASKRSGWGFDLPVRVRVNHDVIGGSPDTEVTKFRGRIRVIDPVPGNYGIRRVYVTAYDIMRDLGEADVREVGLQIDKTEVELLDALLDSLPSDSQPHTRDFDTAVDRYAVAFDDLGSGQKALAVLQDIAVSAFGLIFSPGDGRLRYMSRHTLQRVVTVDYWFNNQLHDIAVPTSLDQVFRHVRVRTNPKEVSAGSPPTDVLYEIPTGTSIAIPVGAQREVWTDYTDPNDRQTRIGGTNVEESLTGGVHYAAFSTEDGSGTDLTADMTVTLDAFASTAKWTIVNNSGQPAYITQLSPIGHAIRNPGPQWREHSTGAANRPIEIDLRYQDDPTVADGVATEVIRLYGDDSGESHRVEAIEFLANYDDDLMEQALLRDIGDPISISDDVTGLSTNNVIIHSVEFRVENDGAALWCRWGVSPDQSLNGVWQLGKTFFSELGFSTKLGF